VVDWLLEAGEARDRSGPVASQFHRSSHGASALQVVEDALAAATIEEFIAVFDEGEVSGRTLATFAANLHAVRESHGLPLDVERRHFAKAAAKAPYRSDEMHVLFEQAQKLPTAMRRHRVTGALCLLFGAGLFTIDAAMVEPDDVVYDSATKTLDVQVQGRAVRVLTAYVYDLRCAALWPWPVSPATASSSGAVVLETAAKVA
jgi:hypothetical protein